MAKKTVGIAARKIVDPDNQQIISRERWQYSKELSKLLLDLGYKVSWWQIGNGWKSEIIPGVPLMGILRDGQQILTNTKASDDFLEKAGWVDFAIYFDLILAYPQVHEYSIAISHGINWDNPLFESSLKTEIERKEWKRRLWMCLQGPQKIVTTDTGLIHWATATWPGLNYIFEYIPSFIPPSQDDKEYQL